MNTCVALLRGINVGGKNSLSMKELVVILEGIGAQNVKTYVQSGNVVFQVHQAGLLTTLEADNCRNQKAPWF